MPTIDHATPRLKTMLSLSACLAAGSLSSLAMAPANAWPVLFIGLSLLYIALSHARTKLVAFMNGWLFGFGYFLFSLSWIGNALLVDGNEYAWAWPLAVAGLPFMLAFFPALASLVCWKLFNLRKISGYLAFVSSFILFEWLRGHVFSGFPWNLFGYSWADILPVIQIVSLGNIYYLTALTILWASLPGFLLVAHTSKKNKGILSACVIFSFMACYAFGAWRIHTYIPEYEENVHIRIVQPSILQPDKWNRNKAAENFFKHVRLSYPDDETDGTVYIIWPETALSFWYTEDSTSMGIITQALQSYPGMAYLLTGLLRHDPQAGTYSNSMVMIGPDGDITNIYDKQHLVPFGEYIPLQKWIPLEPVARFSGFLKGSSPQVFETDEGLAYAPLICYEGIFPRTLHSVPPDNINLIINVTNDAWYGDSAGPHQHYTHALFRAVESGVPLVRSANTGISTLIDPLGRPLYKSKIFTEASEILKLPKKIVVFNKGRYFENAILLFSSLLIMGYAHTRRLQ